MSARQSDNRRIGEIWHATRQLQRRISEGGITREMIVAPRNAIEETVADGVLYNLQRILEETVSLSDGTKVQHPNIPWNDIRGMRNRIVHDYPGTSLDYVWETIETDLPILLDLCLAYCKNLGINIEELAGEDKQRSNNKNS